ncbi:MAG: hypothetical protein ABIO55_15015 [Ginsengibacter sp.]
MDSAKIHLSAEEQRLISNTEWILTKHTIIKKVYEMFGQINDMMKNELSSFDHFFENIQCLNGKITKGENYGLLPYIILDYPYHFEKNNVFAIRTMFWWGNFFSITLHLSGEHKIRFINNTSAHFLLLKNNNFFVCVNNEEWQHHFDENNYKPADKITEMEYKRIIEQPFLKIAKQISLKDWDVAPAFIIGGFKEILELLQINYPDDKKDPSPASPITGSDL